MIARRPGQQPTTTHPESGRTWRYICSTADTGGETLIAQQTVGRLYHYQDHPDLGTGWWGSALGRADSETMMGVTDRADIQAAIERRLIENGYVIVDPAHDLSAWGRPSPAEFM